MLESVLLTHPAVVDCAAIERVETSGARVLVAYVTASSRVRVDELRRFAAERFPENAPNLEIVSVSSLPLTIDGDIDIARLENSEVADEALAAAWERTVARVAGPGQVAALVHDRARRAPALHLSDVLPDWVANEASVAATGVLQAGDQPLRAASGRPAIAYGGPLAASSGTVSPLSEWLARAATGDGGLTYVEADGVERHQSHTSLAHEARCVAQGLRQNAVVPGARVLLQCDRLQDFLEAFWACILSGAIPVPLAVPPRYDVPSAPLETLHAAWEILEQPTIVTRRGNIDGLRLSTATLQPAPRLLAIEDLRVDAAEIQHRGSPDHVALLMLTSGSTGTPKAVMLTHANLWSRTAGSRQMNGFSANDISLNWMPLDHVAGLIYFHLRDVFLGCRQVHVSTSHILQEPLRWLDYLERYRATVTFAPNFAYGLINDRAGELGFRRRDLSSVRLILNGAEAIVARTARRFLCLLEPHGLSASSMHPAWGMSETSSGVTYSDRFSLDQTSDDDAFVEVGRPVPELTMRIVDANGTVVDENVVGRLQVRGPMVTRGYFRTPELTREAFTADGWFMTGDLALIRDGRLTITGREKDVVIVNSVNYHCHALEAVVEEVPGVEPSYTAACAVRRGSANTDQLAVFFHPRVDGDDQLSQLMSAIRGDLTRKAGISPDFLIPIEPKDIPKTSLGKIQRSELSRRLLAGSFDEAMKRADVVCANVRTVPNWFYRKVWRKRRGARREPSLEQQSVLIFLDAEGVGAELLRLLERRGVHCATVTAGTAYGHDSGRFIIDTGAPGDVHRMVTQLRADGRMPTLVVHLWSYGRYEASSRSPQLDVAQAYGTRKLLRLVRAVSAAPAESLRLMIAASHVHRVERDDPVASEKAAMLGLVHSMPQELPWLECCHIDLYDRERAVDLLLEEIDTRHRDRVIAYRNGCRYLPGLARVRFSPGVTHAPAFKRQGLYLVTGAAGGMAVPIASALAARFGARLLLTGRGAADGRTTALVRQVQEAGGDAVYVQSDVCNEAQLREAIDAHEQRWQRRLDGVIHLAGVYREGGTTEVSEASFDEVLRPKAVGSVILQRLLAEKGGGLFVSSSSVAGVFGGAAVGAYAAANAFQQAFAEEHHGRNGVAHFCAAWSNWDGIGQSRDFQLKDAARTRGYLPISSERGVQSLLIGAAASEPVVIVGLDSTQPFIRRHLQEDAAPVNRIAVFSATSALAAEAAASMVADRFGVRSAAEFIRLSELPRRSDGAIDRERLAAHDARAGRNGHDARPETDVERRLAHLWADMLLLADVNLDDSFFSLGGDSLHAVRLLGRIRDAFGVDLPIRAIFDADTLRALAALISQAQRDSTATSNEPSAMPHAEQHLLDHLADLSEAEIDSLLRQLEGQH